VTARLFLLAFAIGFTPMWTMLGLVAAAQSRVAGGADATGAMATLVSAVSTVFFAFIALGTAFALLLSRSLTRPLVQTAAALARIRTGELDAAVAVESNDEVGTLAQGVNELAHALRDRERILGAFGRAVDPAVRDRLLRGDASSSGETRTATILFADLRGFTAMAEREPAPELVEWLNRYFDAMTAWVGECGGFVDKFVGDAMLVVFGLFADQTDASGRGPAPAPEPAARSAAAGVRCALGMRERLVALNRARESGGKPPLSLGAGVHTGDVIAGTIGATDRHEYTVIGDAVNVAERLQEQTRELGCDVVVSEHTAALARLAGLVVHGTEREIALRGRAAPIRVVLPA
jgi:adenylate cyclase